MQNDRCLYKKGEQKMYISTNVHLMDEFSLGNLQSCYIIVYCRIWNESFPYKSGTSHKLMVYMERQSNLNELSFADILCPNDNDTENMLNHC